MKDLAEFHPTLKHTRAYFGGGTDVNIPQQNFTNELGQIYQGIANTAGPYFNLSSILGPGYGQQGLSNLQQQLFGYNSSGAAGSIGTPATPPGGFFGGGGTGAAYPPSGKSGGIPANTDTLSALFGTGLGTSGGAPPATTTSYAGPGGQPANLGNVPSGYQAPGPTPPGASPYPVGAGVGGVPSSGGTATGGNTLYSPPSGTLIGLGKDNPLNDPYAGQVPPSQTAGYHPGVLDLNTTALASYGPLGTLSLLQANPFLSDALSMQNANLFNTANSPLLDTLNAQANAGLAQGGALTPEQQRTATQGALSSLPGGLQNTPQSFAAELLGRDQFANQRLLQAQQFGQTVQGLNTTQSGLLGNLANQAGSLASSAITNPLLQILGLGNLNTNANPSTSIQDQNALFNPFQQLGADVFNFNSNAAANSNIANANNAAAQNSGWLSLVGSLFSDKRLKKNIKKIGVSPNGLNIYEFSYSADPASTRYRGVIAQELLLTNPEAVLIIEDGYFRVDYSKIDVPFEEVQQPELANAA